MTEPTTFKRTPGTARTCVNCSKQDFDHFWRCKKCNKVLKETDGLPGEKCCGGGAAQRCV